MAFNLFGPATNNDIRVGYISTERGFISNVSICEANEYARVNPGTTFIFQTRDVIKYLNINEVNSLTADDLTPNSSGDNCGGIQLENECTPAQVFFYGGGGVGVKANPVIGQDGSILAIDLVSGGNGYQYSPIVQVKDGCGIGNGAVIRAILGQIVEVTEVYDTETEFEEYELCEPTDVGYGRRYGPNGEDLGPWDPVLYTNLSKDPISKEIDDYQNFLRQLTKPWWTTRKFAPLRLTSSNKVTRTKFDVDLKNNEFFPEDQWSSFLNEYAISPVPPSNVPGSDFAGIPFTFEWEEDFPYDGEYVFRGLCDNKAEFYLDNVKISDLRGFRDNPEIIKKNIKAGVHRIRLDLLNIPVKEKVLKQLDTNKSNEVTFKVSTSADNANSINISDLGISLNKKRLGDQLKETITKTVEFGKVYSVRITSGGPTKLRLKGSSVIEMEDGTDNDYNDLIFSCSQGRFFDLNTTTNECKFVLDPPDNPQGSQSSTTQENKIRNVFNTVDYINRADRSLWRINPTAGRDSDFFSQYGVLPFDPGSAEAQTESFGGTHTIRWFNVDFPVSGNYNIEIMVDDNVNLTLTGTDSETIIEKRGFSTPERSTGKTLETRFFKAGRYTITAELDQLRGKPLSGGNPMALAVKIETAAAEVEVISAKSWNENPMGVALTIDAPFPPIPQEPIPEQEGRCPRNPIWTTRFPNASEKWYPVKFGDAWGAFMNRYAISPIAPLSESGSDGSGIVYRNSWDLDIPYDGFYGLKGTVDNGGRILIDGNEIISGGLNQKKRNGLEHFKNEIPETKKFFLSKGLHNIEVEVENEKIDTFITIDKKVFSTSDWSSVTETSRQTGNVDVNFRVTSSADFANLIEIQDLFTSSKSYLGPQINENLTRSVEIGKVYNVRFVSKRGPRLRIKNNSIIQMEDSIDNDYNDIVCSASQGRFFDINGNTCKFVVEGKLLRTGGLTSGTAKDGVIYSGPTLATYASGTLGPFLTPAFTSDEDYRANNMDRTWTLRWENVDFPEDGRYDLKAEADDYVIVRVDGVEVGRAEVFEGVRSYTFNVSKGKRTIEMEIYNIPGNDQSTFTTNPIVFNAVITTKVQVISGVGKPWTQNPIGISAILIPPPCPKRIRGKGVVTDVVVDDPGNGYPIPSPPGEPTVYPATLRIKDVIVEDPGINYSPNDQIQIIPDNGAVLEPIFDNFGKLAGVNVASPGFGFTGYPEITIPSDTGVNAILRPQFEVIRDPIVSDPETLIQVTDLVGLKQTGYVDGRAYYGAVFYKDGIRYAGFYETVGDLVRVYDTLQESITAEVVTPPSAILRQGTDVNSNNPRLNIPGTPENLI